MSPNPDAAEEELPFKEGQVIKVGAPRGAWQGQVIEVGAPRAGLGGEGALRSRAQRLLWTLQSG